MPDAPRIFSQPALTEVTNARLVRSGRFESGDGVGPFGRKRFARIVRAEFEFEFGVSREFEETDSDRVRSGGQSAACGGPTCGVGAVVVNERFAVEP